MVLLKYSHASVTLELSLLFIDAITVDDLSNDEITRLRNYLQRVIDIKAHETTTPHSSVTEVDRDSGDDGIELTTIANKETTTATDEEKLIEEMLKQFTAESMEQGSAIALSILSSMVTLPLEIASWLELISVKEVYSCGV